VLIPEGKIALGKLSQAMMHGSVVIQIRGNFDDGMRLVQLAAESTSVALVTKQTSTAPWYAHAARLITSIPLPSADVTKSAL